MMLNRCKFNEEMLTIQVIWRQNIVDNLLFG